MVGIYARLSVDSGERKNESIENQIEIAKKFVKLQKDMIVVDCYTDIGKSGTNFVREGFERMIQDVKSKKINCIIVKDLSRFGRNHLEMGIYVEKIFPLMGIRFIAVTDHYDSKNISGQSDGISFNIKNLVNEMYAKDISRKVKSLKKMKQEQGSFVGGMPPYGYKTEWNCDKRCLVPEKGTSDIVKQIFDLFVSGKTISEIVKWLYNERILTPLAYHKSGQIFWEKEKEGKQWSVASVRRILTNPVYKGCFSGKTVEPIISGEIFRSAEDKFEKKRAGVRKYMEKRENPGAANMFSGILFCGDCGAKMYRYNCPYATRIDNKKCITKNISSDRLIKIIKQEIDTSLMLSFPGLDKILERNRTSLEKEKGKWYRKLLCENRKVEKFQRNLSENYVKYRIGEMDVSTFVLKKQEIERKISRFREEYEKAGKKIKQTDIFQEKFEEVACAVLEKRDDWKLTEKCVRIFVERIEVYQDKRIRIIFNLGGFFGK